jgi:hypothetical protein
MVQVLIDCSWNTNQAAQRLGIHRATVYRRMRQLGLDWREFAPLSREPRPNSASREPMTFGEDAMQARIR